MIDITNKSTSRREFLKNTGRIAATSAFMAAAAPRMYAGENNTIKVALVGCGGRGTGAASDALSVKYGPMKRWSSFWLKKKAILLRPTANGIFLTSFSSPGMRVLRFSSIINIIPPQIVSNFYLLMEMIMAVYLITVFSITTRVWVISVKTLAPGSS